MERWLGKTAVVTGAGGGIGGAIADKLCAAGLRVVALDVNTEPPQSKSQQNKMRTFIQCDIRNLTTLKQTFEMIEKEYGGVDVMVNCAGVARKGQITSVGPNPISDEDIATIYDVNIKAMVFCSRYAIESMKRRGVAGHVVNINSVAGHYVAFHEDFNVYSSSKHAVNAFTQALFQEMSIFKNKIKVTSVSPGLVQTPLSGAITKDFSNVAALQPSDVADAVAYVISTTPHVNISELTVQSVGDIRM